jgi:hypothetical protein
MRDLLGYHGRPQLRVSIAVWHLAETFSLRRGGAEAPRYCSSRGLRAETVAKLGPIDRHGFNGII